MESKVCALAIETVHLDLTSHLFDHPLADIEPQAGSLGIHFGVLVKFTELHE